MYHSSSQRPSGRKPGFSGARKSAHPHSGRPSTGRSGTSSSHSASGSRFSGPRKSFSSASSGGFSRGSSRPSFRGSGSAPSGGFSRGSDSRGGFRGGSRTGSGGSFSRGRGGSRGGRGGGFAHKRIDVSRYINKGVTPQAPVAPYVPTHTFADFALDVRVKANIEKKGYVTPTPIQDQSIPHILSGKDIVGIANTGTGKTAAFLLPLIHKVLSGTKERILVLAPTRELAQQIDAEFKEFARGLKLFSVCAVGGASIGMQLRDLKHYNDFVIGTPGRIRDLMKRHAIDLSKFNTVVLDEADRMLDMGFIHEVKAMLAIMPPKRHTIFFSATLSSDIERLIKDFLNEPVRVSVKTGETSKNIEQDVIHVKNGAVKFDLLIDLLKQEGFGKVLVFGRTKHGVQKLSDMLEKSGVRSVAIHGNKSQSQRMRALQDFKAHKAQVMVATDVAARGLDIADISHVINYDVPGSHEDYIHRIGRTGRGNKQGKALTFVESH